MSEDSIHPQPPGIEQQADDRLMHALLVQIYDPLSAGHRRQRLDRLMQALNGEVSSSATSPAADGSAVGRARYKVWAGRRAWAVAAMIAIALGILALTRTSSSAMASVDNILAALEGPGDRTYRLLVEPPTPPVSSRPGLDEALLYLRGGTQYLLVRKSQQGGDLLDGYDGRQSWRVRAGELAEVRNGLGAGGIPVPQPMQDVPFVDLRQTLAQLRSDYAVEQTVNSPLENGGRPLLHVLAGRKSRAVKGPPTIEIWADPQSGIPVRIIFDRAKFQGSQEPRRLTFELVSESPLPADFFRAQAHLAG
jgi:hypothetical protein